jgi:membrane protease YdiL (CAAX protease family)
VNGSESSPTPAESAAVPEVGPQSEGAVVGYGAPAADFLLPGEAESADPGFRPLSGGGVAVAFAVMVGLGIVTALFGQAGNYLTGALEVLPFAAIATFAYLGRRYTWGTVFAHLGSAFLLVLLILGSLGLLFAASTTAGAPSGPWNPYLMFCAWLAAALAAAVLLPLPAVQARVATVLPVRPGDTVHGVALGLVASFTLVSLGQLAATGGRPALLTLIASQPALLGQMKAEDVIGSLVLTFIWTVPATAVAVGWPLVRSLPQALERLGFVRPTLRQVVGAVVIAGLMVGAAQGLEFGLNALWDVTRWPKTDLEAFEKLLKPLITPTGAVVIGITAGVGEELLVRGVLQPRLGMLLSNLFFTSLHAFQYGFDGLISVFLAGAVLGLVRARSNTSTAAIVHGTYDFILVMLAALTAAK